jgi:hypothetical protein
MNTTRTALALCLVLAAGCAESGNSNPGGDPLGTFCLSMIGSENEVCLEEDTLHAYRTTASGYIWFEVGGTIELLSQDTYSGETVTTVEPIQVFGQIPAGSSTPVQASNTLVLAPAPGSCVKTVRISPFGACDTLTRNAVCHARAAYRDDLSMVTVERISETDIELTFTSTVAIDDLHRCCADEADYCDITSPATFTPGGPFAIEGHLHAAFSQ